MFTEFLDNFGMAAGLAGYSSLPEDFLIIL